MQVEEVAAESIVHPPTLDTFQRRGTTQITSLALARALQNAASTLLSCDKYKFTIINSANRVGEQIRRHKFKLLLAAEIPRPHFVPRALRG
jgi:hypothetical protein